MLCDVWIQVESHQQEGTVMGMSASCAHCGASGEIGHEFEMRGKYDGYVVLKCHACGGGLLVTNAGRAMFTKKAKTKAIDDDTWQRMLTDWDKNFSS